MDDRPRSTPRDRGYGPPARSQQPQRHGPPPRSAERPPGRAAGPSGRQAPPAPPARRRGPRRGAKIAVTLVSLLVMSLTGYAWAAMEGLVSGLTLADVIGDDGGGPQPADGARDILLVGMDSRTDAQGNPLPEDVLAKLHAGAAEGERNTDTIILVHIPNDGSKAVAISFPRDSYVEIPGFGQHKINSAYPRAQATAREQLQEQGVTDPKELERRSNDEGAKTLISTVERLSGFTVDNYASINLLGFYSITEAIGGVKVCLKQPVDDPYSGADFPAGVQTISGADALAFVRQRHGLPRGDLDRVKRQQAFMAGLANKVLSAGTLTDPGKLNGLVDAIKSSVVLDSGWDIFGFATQMKNLTGGQIEFHTIPIENIDYRTPDGQTAVKIDPDQVRQFIAGLGAPPPQPPAGQASQQAPPPAKGEITVDVSNGNGTGGLAANVSANLASKGFGTGEIANTAARQNTVVQVASGERAAGEQVAKALGGGQVTVTESGSVPAGHVRVLLGDDYSATGTGPSGQTAPGSDTAQGNPSQGSPAPGPDSDEPIKADGVACVN